MARFLLDRRISFILAASLFGFLGYSYMSRLSVEMSARHRFGLFIEPADLSLGEIWAGAAVSKKLRLHNKSQREILVDGFNVGCDCMSFDRQRFRIAAKSREDLLLTVICPERPQNANREVNLKFSALVHGVNSLSEPWTLTAVPRLPVQPDSTLKLIGDIPTESLMQEFRPMHVTVLDEIVVTPKEIAGWRIGLEPAKASDLVYAETSTGPSNSAGTKRLAVVVNSKSICEVGFFSIPVELEATWRDGRVAPTSRCTIEGYATGDVSANPRILLGGLVAKGEEMSFSLKLIASSEKPFRVVDIQSTEQELLTLIPEISPRPGEMSIDVVCKCYSEGPKQASIMVDVLLDGQSRRLRVRVPVTWRVVSTDI